jgi:hypothetical protein
VRFAVTVPILFASPELVGYGKKFPMRLKVLLVAKKPKRGKLSSESQMQRLFVTGKRVKNRHEW